MSEKEVLRRLMLGREYVVNKAPYIASTLLEMTPVVVDRPGVTMGITRGLVLYVGEKWLLSDPEVQSDEAVGACLYHECEHVLRGFHRLEALPDKEVANVAADAAINDNLQDEGWKLPPWAVFPENLGLPKGKTLEQYYELLQEKLNEKQQSLKEFMDEMSDGNDGDESPNGGGSGGEGSSKGWEPKVGAGVCGSGAGAAVEGAEDGLEATLDTEYGKTPIEIEAIRQQTLSDIENFMKGRGSAPGRFKSLLEFRIARPRVDWKRMLRSVMRRTAQVSIAGARDYSMSRPSIGSSMMGVVAAGLIDRKIELLIAEDTSGSMSSEDSKEARNEMYHILRSLGLQEAWHIQCDARVQSARRIRLRQIPKMGIEGRGGTDFRPVFDAVSKIRPRPNLVVFLTDGDGPAPATPPKGVEVVWCVVGSYGARRPANWGRIVRCGNNSDPLLPPL